MKTIKNFVYFYIAIFAVSAVLAPPLDVEGGNVCSNNNCVWITCNSDQDCGQNSFYGPQECQGNSIYQSFRTYTCHNRGLQTSYCTNSSSLYIQRTCDLNQICQYGSCVPIPAPESTQISGNQSYYAPQTIPNPSYIEHYRTFCYGNNVYWFDSMENARDIYKKCADENSCTIDLCADNACKNTLKCDGSICARDSADYKKYCETESEKQDLQTVIQKALTKNENMAISLLAMIKEGDNFQESIKGAKSGDKILFQTVIENKSGQPIENISLKIDFANEISYGEELKIDGVESAGDIISGINIGTIPNGITKKISFSGNIKQGITDGDLKITATVSAGNTYNEDSAIINAGEIPQEKSGFVAALGNVPLGSFFVKRYPWFIAGIILLILFWAIYKKLSSET